MHLTIVVERSKELGELSSYVLEDKDIIEFYQVIGTDMEVLGKAMGFRDATIAHIRMEAPYSVPTQVMKMFTKWRNKTRHATLGMLCEVFEKAERGGTTVYWDVYEEAIIRIRGMSHIELF